MFNNIDTIAIILFHYTKTFFLVSDIGEIMAWGFSLDCSLSKLKSENVLAYYVTDHLWWTIYDE